jgi:hypothetical protein
MYNVDMKGAFLMKNCNYYIKTFILKNIRKCFDYKYIGGERVVEIKNGKKIFNDDNVRKFYETYETELNSFSPLKLKKIFNETKLKIEMEIIDKRKIKTRKIIINQYGMSYTDIKNKNDSISFYDEYYQKNLEQVNLFTHDIEYNVPLDKRVNYIDSESFEIVEPDLKVYRIFKKIGRDKKGIYVIDGKKIIYVGDKA